jgi:hypothetical protein
MATKPAATCATCTATPEDVDCLTGACVNCATPRGKCCSCCPCEAYV